MRRKQK